MLQTAISLYTLTDAHPLHGFTQQDICTANSMYYHLVSSVHKNCIH